MRASLLLFAAFAAAGLSHLQAAGLNDSIDSTYIPGFPVGCTEPKQNPELAQALYVATLDEIDVFTLGSQTPRIHLRGGLAGVSQIAVDAMGRRYASNFGTSNYTDSSVTEYQRSHGDPSLTRTNGAFSANGVAVDSCGNVYASSYYRNTISVYHAEQANPFLEITSPINGPGQLEFHHGNLFVGEFGTAQIVQLPCGSILNLKAPGTLPQGALTYGGNFAVGPDGTIYAAGYVVSEDVGYEEFVNVFAPGATSPRASVVVSTGREAASAPYVAFSGTSLFVSVSDTNTVYEYNVGTELTVVRQITAGLSQPGPIALDRSGTLYVADGGGAVLSYVPGQTGPSFTTFPSPSEQPLVSILLSY